MSLTKLIRHSDNLLYTSGGTPIEIKDSLGSMLIQFQKFPSNIELYNQIRSNAKSLSANSYEFCGAIYQVQFNNYNCSVSFYQIEEKESYSQKELFDEEDYNDMRNKFLSKSPVKIPQKRKYN